MLRIYFLLIGLFISRLAIAQCVNTFPYVQDFETSQGGWTSGGTLSDWAWGAPAKTVITGAGSGNKCWVTGGLIASFYNYGELSYVQSPCFDFTNLQYPYIKFLIFWESERKYDGTNLQYSLDGGTTWTNVGAFGDAEDCLNKNWFNESSINYLNGLASPKSGWGGNIQATQGSCQGGSGSGGWVTASHCISSLAGQANVVFRFTFGAGTTCNSFDGIAFDSIAIGEAPPNSGDFTFVCSDTNTYSFTGIANLCPNVISWNFGDPNSGAANTADSLNAAHTFSGPGSYTVTLSLSGPCNAPVTITKTVNVLNLSSVVHDVSCFGGSDGSISITVNNGEGPFNYNWGGGITTQNRTGLDTGTYTLTVSNSETCPATLSATVNEPLPINVIATPLAIPCAGVDTSSINVSVSGGTSPYQFHWNDGATSQNRSGVASGTYKVTVTDSHSCTAIDSTTIIFSNKVSVLLPDTGFCPGQFVVLSIGNGFTNAQWSTGSHNDTIQVAAVGSYYYTAMDTNGCIVESDTNSIGARPGPNLHITASPNAICIGEGATTLNAGSGSGVSYLWLPGEETTDSIKVLQPGTYYVTGNENGCVALDSINLLPSDSPVISLPVSVTKCCDTVVLIPTVDGNYTYLWSDNSTGTSLVISSTQNEAAIYSVTATNTFGCTATQQTSVTIKCIQAKAFASPDTVIIGDSTMVSVATAYNSGLTYFWLSDSGNLANPLSSSFDVSPTEKSIYKVVVQDTLAGCIDSSNVTVYVLIPGKFVMPNAFTPNGDGKNDNFYPVIKGDEETVTAFTIYNRWGQLVHNSTDPWDGKFKGKEQPAGTYVYYIVVRGINPNNYNAFVETKLEGSVVLLR